MGEVQINHGGGDLFVAEKFLDGVEWGPCFQKMGGKAVTQGMNLGRGDVELLACSDDETLEGGAGHGSGGRPHALGQGFEILIPASDVGEEKQGMLVNTPIILEFLVEGGGKRNDTVEEAFTATDEELVLLALDVVDGEGEALA